MNIAYKDFWVDIVDLDKNYGWDKWTTDIVSDRNEYILKQPDGTKPDRKDKWGMEKIETVSIKYDTTDVDFDLCDITDYDYLDFNIEYYEENQPQDDPFVIISDNSIFVYPTPDTNVTNGLELQGIRSPFDLDATTTSSLDILVPKAHREVIAIGMKQYAYAKRMLLNEKNDAIMEYKDAKKKALMQLSTRKTTPTFLRKAEDLSHLE